MITKTELVSNIKRPNSPQRLNPIAVRNLPLPPPGEQWLVWDATTAGFGLRLNHGGKVYICQARNPNGKAQRRYVGAANGEDALGVAEARKKARALIANIEAGKDVELQRKRLSIALVSETPAVQGAPTFGEARSEFIEWAKTNLRSWKSYKALLHRPEMVEWESRALAEIGRKDILEKFKAIVANIESNGKDYLVAREAEGRPILEGELRHGAGVSANRWRCAMSALFGYAGEFLFPRDERLVSHNPAVGWRKLRQVEKGRSRKIDLADVPALWHAFDRARQPWNIIYKLILLTGCRRHEIQSLRVDRIVCSADKPDARLELGSLSKDGEGLDRVIVLTSLAVELLSARLANLPKGAQYVFGIDRPLPDDSSKDATARKDAGLSYHWHVHGFRTVVGEYLRSQGVSQDIIDGVIGHQLLGARGKYAKRPPVGEMRKALVMWETYLRGVLKLPPA